MTIKEEAQVFVTRVTPPHVTYLIRVAYLTREGNDRVVHRKITARSASQAREIAIAQTVGINHAHYGRTVISANVVER